jgi:hypothetical protein
VKEPRVHRLPRQRRTSDIFPRCGRCGKVLRGMQVRWCSHACRQAGSRMAHALERYWSEVA